MVNSNNMNFLEIRFIDVVDVVLVAYLMYRLYKIIKGTVALNIFLGIFAFIVLWLLIRAFNMQLSSMILDNFVNVGVLAVIILFQQEIRRFLLQVGSRYNLSNKFSLDKFLMNNLPGMMNFYIKPVVRACEDLSRAKIGALIVLTRKSELEDFIQTGELLNAIISRQLLVSLFYKNSPLHDGAVIIGQSKIKAASCILPVSQNMDIPKSAGLRHRAALGIAEFTDAISIVVSEETGKISFFRDGKGEFNISVEELEKRLNSEFMQSGS